MRPSRSRPNSYLVSTRISPRAAAISRPRAKRASAFPDTSSHCAALSSPRGDDLRRGDRLVVLAVAGLGGGGEDRLRQLLVLAQAVGKAVPVHLAPAGLVHRPDRGAGGAGHIVAHDDLDRHDVEPAAHQHVGVGVFDDVVGADVAGVVEPEPRGLGQHLALAGDRGDATVEGRKAVGGDDDAPPVGQVVIVAHLAAVMVGQLGDGRVVENEVEAAGEQ